MHGGWFIGGFTVIMILRRGIRRILKWVFIWIKKLLSPNPKDAEDKPNDSTSEFEVSLDLAGVIDLEDGIVIKDTSEDVGVAETDGIDDGVAEDVVGAETVAADVGVADTDNIGDGVAEDVDGTETDDIGDGVAEDVVGAETDDIGDGVTEDFGGADTDDIDDGVAEDFFFSFYRASRFFKNSK